MMARRVLAALLVALLAVPVGASPSKASPAAAIPIGTCSYSDSANIGGAGALAGTTVFSGDLVEVGPRGSAWILMNSGMQVRVSAASRLRLTQLTSGTKPIEMEIFSGAARFRTSEASQVVARLADATARAKGAKPAVGIISVLSSKRAIIAAELGELLVSTAHDGRSLTLREGETVELMLADPPAPGMPQGGSSGIGTLTGKQVAIIGIVTATILTIIALWLGRDNKGLTDQEKQNLVSPFKFP
jgi:hypothetical protein